MHPQKCFNPSSLDTLWQGWDWTSAPEELHRGGSAVTGLRHWAPRYHKGQRNASCLAPVPRLSSSVTATTHHGLKTEKRKHRPLFANERPTFRAA